MDAITPQEAQRIVAAYLELVDAHAAADEYPCASRDLPQSKQRIEDAFRICVATLESIGELTPDLRDYLEVAYVSLADYLDDEGVGLLREYGRAGRELAADRRYAREKVASDAWHRLLEQSGLAGQLARTISDDADRLRAEFRSWLTGPPRRRHDQEGSVMSTVIPLALHRSDLTDGSRRASLPPDGGEKLPEPPFPRKPDLLTDEDLPGDGTRHWTPGQIYRAMRGWAFPYVKSRLLAGDFHPIVAYLFTEFKCNLDCHYCYSFDNRVKGMTEEVARATIDWLHATTCRVLALMGGEVMLRPRFVHKVIDYAAGKGFFTYIPTNGRLLKPDWIDRLADAGVATFNLAVDAVDEKPGLPKALNPIRPYFDYLVRKQYRYGYTVFLNINICRNNLDDVKQLTEIARDHNISTDYHINEMPLIEQQHFRHLDDENPTYIRPQDRPEVGRVLDWLIEKQKAGYGMTNSVERLAQMKDFIKGELEPWNCRAGRIR